MEEDWQAVIVRARAETAPARRNCFAFIVSCNFSFRIRDFHLLWLVFPGPFFYKSLITSAVRTPTCTHVGLGSYHFARRYFGNRCFFLFLRLLRCFSSPGSPPQLMDWAVADRFNLPGFPIQISADQCVFATPRSFSQLITSFFGS